MMDIFEVGTGGGSIARIADEGGLRVGPESRVLNRVRLLWARRHFSDSYRRERLSRTAVAGPFPWR